MDALASMPSCVWLNVSRVPTIWPSVRSHKITVPSIEFIKACVPLASAESDVRASAWGGRLFMSCPVAASLSNRLSRHRSQVLGAVLPVNRCPVRRNRDYSITFEPDCCPYGVGMILRGIMTMYELERLVIVSGRSLGTNIQATLATDHSTRYSRDTGTTAILHRWLEETCTFHRCHFWRGYPFPMLHIPLGLFTQR
jgi:hypothetical protein